MADSVLGFIQELSKPKRDALQTQAQADIAARNTALHTEKLADAVAQPNAEVVEKIVATDASEGQVEAGKAGAVTEENVMKALGVVNEEQGVILLVGGLADAIDLDQDSVPSSLLVKCAHDFCGRDGRTFKANHNEQIGASLVESMTGVPILKSGRRLKAGEHIPIDDPMVSIGLIKAEGEATAWVAGVKPADPAIVAEAKAGRVAGASWGGMAKRTAKA